MFPSWKQRWDTGRPRPWRSACRSSSNGIAPTTRSKAVFIDGPGAAPGSSGRAADLRRAYPLQPRHARPPAAEDCGGAAAQGRRGARAGIELRRRRHAGAARRGARPDRPRAAALPAARRPRDLDARRGDRGLRRGAAQALPLYRDRGVPRVGRRHGPAHPAAHGAARAPAQDVHPHPFRRGRGERVFRQDPDARVLWAHAGFDSPERVREMLRKHKNLWCDLSWRTDHAPEGKLNPDWRKVFLELPDRFLLGTDTPSPQRWYFIPEHARLARLWLSELPPEAAEAIAWRNGERVFGPAAAALKSK